MSAAAELPWEPRGSETGVRLLFENAPVGFAQLLPEGTVTALNPALERMLAGSSGSARSFLFADLVHRQDQPKCERLLSELLEGERDSFVIDSNTTDPQGRPMQWTAWRVTGTEGNSDYLLALTQGAPDGRESDQRLRQAAKLEAVGRLAGGIAHDFNNLLTGVLLYCDLLMSSLEPGHRVRKYAEEIRNAGIQASGLVRQLLSVARPTNSEPRLLSLNEIAGCMRNLLARLIGENIELEFHLDPNLGLVKMDPTQAQQILLNLVLNARDAVALGGHIAVRTNNCKVQVLTERVAGPGNSASLPCALFEVADNGCGMDDATRAHLFESFFTTKAVKGTGLGLATVHDIVTSNGGLIHVDSAPACGTRVTVLLPLVPEAALSSNRVSAKEPNEGVLLAKEKE